jgi:phosphoribosylamine--glycine ligase
MLNIPNHPLKVLVVGNGGREHALCWKLAQSPLIEQAFCAPGNGGTAKENKTKNINIDSHDFPKLAEFCQNEHIDLTVVGPENILAEGIVNYFAAKHLRIFGPTKEASRLEWSKSYAKEFMGRNNIPTAKFKICHSYDEAKHVVETETWAQVIKVDGLASGKGVFVCNNPDEAKHALTEVFQRKHFGKAGETVVLEEKLYGEEISLFLLCDGKTFLPMEVSQDNKRRFDNDLGPNTGGMGVISPPTIYAKHQKVIEKTIIQPLLAALKKDGINYQGLLYVGLLLDQDKQTGSIQPKILEFNSRFGDPETQVVLPRLQSDLLPALWACTEGNLDEIKFEWKKEACCCVVAVNKDYPACGSNDQPINLNTNSNSPSNDIIIFHAGTKIANKQLVTAGGRILAITALASDLQLAASRIYEYLPNINFKDMDYRKDIAQAKTGSCMGEPCKL